MHNLTRTTGWLTRAVQDEVRSEVQGAPIVAAVTLLGLAIVLLRLWWRFQGALLGGRQHGYAKARAAEYDADLEERRLHFDDVEYYDGVDAQYAAGRVHPDCCHLDVIYDPRYDDYPRRSRRAYDDPQMLQLTGPEHRPYPSAAERHYASDGMMRPAEEPRHYPSAAERHYAGDGMMQAAEEHFPHLPQPNDDWEELQDERREQELIASREPPRWVDDRRAAEAAQEKMEAGLRSALDLIEGSNAAPAENLHNQPLPQVEVSAPAIPGRSGLYARQGDSVSDAAAPSQVEDQDDDYLVPPPKPAKRSGLYASSGGSAKAKKKPAQKDKEKPAKRGPKLVL